MSVNKKQKNMNQNVTPAEVKTAIKIMAAVASSVKELGRVPSGHVYAMLMGRMDFQQFQAMENCLLKTGLVKKEGDEYVWKGGE